MHLLNSAMAPNLDGDYSFRKITPTEFWRVLREAMGDHRLKNYIGYGDNLRILREEFGIELQPNREQAVIADGDELLIMRLTYRVRDPREKTTDVRHCLADFEFALATFRAKSKPKFGRGALEAI